MKAIFAALAVVIFGFGAAVATESKTEQTTATNTEEVTTTSPDAPSSEEKK